MNDRTNAPRYLAFALMCALLASTGCGGGGGDDDGGGGGGGGGGPPPLPLTLDIISTPELDGVVFANGVSNEGRTDLQPTVGDGPFVVGSGSSVFQAYYSFDLTALPAGTTITSASLSLFLRDTLGNPDGMTVHIKVDHVNFGAIFPVTPLGGTTLAFDFARIEDAATPGRRDIDVVAQVQADLDAGRPRSQFRLRGAINSNNDGAADVAFFTDGDDSLGSGELPILSLEFETP